jgi:hypothetical protein
MATQTEAPAQFSAEAFLSRLAERGVKYFFAG